MFCKGKLPYRTLLDIDVASEHVMLGHEAEKPSHLPTGSFFFFKLFEKRYRCILMGFRAKKLQSCVILCRVR
jgi:hypothetical protein